MAQAEHDYAAARRELLTSFPMILQMLQQAGGPELALAGRMGSMEGAKLGQDTSAALGSLGGGSTGVGSLTRGMAATFATQFQSQARLKWLQDAMSNALNLQVGALQAGTQGKGKMGWEDVLGGAAQTGAMVGSSWLSRPSTGSK